jgi:hypothetical protein
MKLVRENINEKFKEKSDPIKDMGIGLEKYKKPQNDIDDFFNLVDEYMLELKNVKNWNKLRDDYFDYIKICGNEMRSPFDVGNKIFRDLKRRKLLGVNEIFQEDSDPVRDMGIGAVSFDEIAKKTIQNRKISAFDAMNKWSIYLESLQGKKIMGKFYVYTNNIKSPKLALCEFIVRDCASFRNGSYIIFSGKDKILYQTSKNQRYVIR